MKTKTINQFLFKLAEYKISGKSSKVVLQVDYQNNKYKIKKFKQDANESFIQEVEEIAQDLLKRKHNVNFAEKEIQ